MVLGPTSQADGTPWVPERVSSLPPGTTTDGETVDLAVAQEAIVAINDEPYTVHELHFEHPAAPPISAAVCAVADLMTVGGGDELPPVPALWPVLLHMAAQIVAADEYKEVTKMTPEAVSADNLDRYAALLRSPFQAHRDLGVLFIRKLLSVNEAPPIGAVLATGAMPYLARELAHQTAPTALFEAAWAVTNIASGTSNHTLLVACTPGVLRTFIDLLRSTEDENVREQCTWALGNIAGEGAHLRDAVLHRGGLEACGHVIHRWLASAPGERKISMLRNAVWAYSNLCRAKPPPPEHLVTPAFAKLAHLVSSAIDEEVCIDSLWGLSYLTDNNQPAWIDRLLDTGVFPEVAARLAPPARAQVVTPALRIVGNVAAGNQEQTSVVLKGGTLGNIAPLVHHPKRAVRKDAFWTLSNVSAGTTEQIQAVIDNCLAQLTIDNTNEIDVATEAAWVVSNILDGGTHEQLNAVVKSQLLGDLLRLSTVALLIPKTPKEWLDVVIKALDLDCGVVLSHLGGGDGAVDALHEMADDYVEAPQSNEEQEACVEAASRLREVLDNVRESGLPITAPPAAEQK